MVLVWAKSFYNVNIVVCDQHGALRISLQRGECFISEGGHAQRNIHQVDMQKDIFERFANNFLLGGFDYGTDYGHE